MKSIKLFTLLFAFIATTFTFFSCETTCNLELPKQEKQQGKDEVRVTVNVVELDENGNEIPSTRAGEKGVVGGAGLYHKGEDYKVFASANDGYALVKMENQTKNEKIKRKTITYAFDEKQAEYNVVYKVVFTEEKNMERVLKIKPNSSTNYVEEVRENLSKDRHAFQGLTEGAAKCIEFFGIKKNNRYNTLNTADYSVADPTITLNADEVLCFRLPHEYYIQNGVNMNEFPFKFLNFYDIRESYNSVTRKSLYSFNKIKSFDISYYSNSNNYDPSQKHWREVADVNELLNKFDYTQTLTVVDRTLKVKEVYEIYYDVRDASGNQPNVWKFPEGVHNAGGSGY